MSLVVCKVGQHHYCIVKKIYLCIINKGAVFLLAKSQYIIIRGMAKHQSQVRHSEASRGIFSRSILCPVLALPCRADDVDSYLDCLHYV